MVCVLECYNETKYQNSDFLKCINPSLIPQPLIEGHYVCARMIVSKWWSAAYMVDRGRSLHTSHCSEDLVDAGW